MGYSYIANHGERGNYVLLFKFYGICPREIDVNQNSELLTIVGFFFILTLILYFFLTVFKNRGT